MEPKKYNKLVNKTKKQQTHRYRGQASGDRGERQYRGWEWEIQTAGCKTAQGRIVQHRDYRQ